MEQGILKTFPKFISDYPIGDDLFEGKPQERIAENIIAYINDNLDSKNRVIGIDGEWGSGKSNVLEITRKRTKNDYYFFTYDTWGHQEDLARRTFLEELVSDLTKSGLLNKEWNSTIKEKLATKVITYNKETPSFNNSLILIALTILASPFIKRIIEYIFSLKSSENPGFWSYVITAGIVVLIFLGVWLCNSFKRGSKFSIKDLFYLYKGEKIESTKCETITSLEPSVREFRSILVEIIGSLQKSLRLIFVYDNMDRLPASKVKETWSSVHTFFAESRDNSIDAWALIPFDQKHLCHAFGDDDPETGTLTLDYIKKTFSIVFRVAAPTLTDWKTFFTIKFKEAFDYAPPEDAQLMNMFDYLHDSKPIKPREIINFLNELVALKKQWDDKIPFKHLGLFILTKQKIIENPLNSIIEKEYLKKVEFFFTEDAELDQNIAALVFNVENEKSNEVLLRRSIEEALRGEGDILEISKHSAFLSVLDNCFYSTQYDLRKSIIALDSLKEEIKSSVKFEIFWKELTIKFLNSKIIFPGDIDFYFKLVLNLKDNNRRKDLTRSVLKAITKIEDNPTYKGKNYCNIIDEIVEFNAQHKSEIKVFELLDPVVFEPIEFKEFVINCKDSFDLYDVHCNEAKLNAYLISSLSDDIASDRLFINIVKNKYNLSLFQEALEEKITHVSMSDSTTIYETLNIYKDLSKEKPINVKVPTNIAFQLISNPDNPALIDLIFIILSDYDSHSLYIKHPTLVNYLNSDEIKAEEAAQVAEYYIDYGDLIDLATTYKFKLLSDVVKHLTITPVGDSRLSLETVLSKYQDIKREVFASDLNFIKAFLINLSEWDYDSYFESIVQRDAFEKNVGLILIEDCATLSNPLTNKIIEFANAFIEGCSEEDWKKAFQSSPTSFLFQTTLILIKTKTIRSNKLSNYALNAFKDVLIDNLKNNYNPVDLYSWDIILDYFDGRKLGFLFKEIRDELLYNRGVLTVEELIYFKKGLFKYGGLNSKNVIEDVIRKIILPLIKDKEGFESVIQFHEEIIVDIIKKSKESIDEIRGTVLERSQVDGSSSLKEFAKKLGIELVG